MEAYSLQRISGLALLSLVKADLWITSGVASSRRKSLCSLCSSEKASSWLVCCIWTCVSCCTGLWQLAGLLHLNMCVLLHRIVAVGWSAAFEHVCPAAPDCGSSGQSISGFFFRLFRDALNVSVQLFQNCVPRKPPGIPQSEYKGSATKKMPLQYEELIN